MKKLRRWLQQYFAFSPRETKQFLILLLLLLVLLFLPWLYEPAPVPSTTAQDQHVLDSLVAQLELKAAPGKTTKPLQPFNPNQLTKEQWQELGLKPFMAQRILNYRQKVGDFKSKEELGKIYDLPDSLFRQWYLYIQLPDKATAAGRSGATERGNYSSGTDHSTGTRRTFRIQNFNINEADTFQLKQIRGIGSKLSQRIVTFRDKLGGFHSLEQLQEVYGLQPEVIDSLRKYSFVSPAYQPQQIRLNQVTYEELKNHPYLKPYIAKAIIAYRGQHGNFQSVEDLKKVKLVDEALYQKLLPYLSL